MVTPQIGITNRTHRSSSVGNVTWLINGTDPGHILGETMSATWNLSNLDIEFSNILREPSVFRNCSAIPTSSTCNTNVLKVSKLQNSGCYQYIHNLSSMGVLEEVLFSKIYWTSLTYASLMLLSKFECFPPLLDVCLQKHPRPKKFHFYHSQ